MKLNENGRTEAGKGRPGQAPECATPGPALANPDEELSGAEHRRLMRAALGDVTSRVNEPQLIGRMRDLRGRYWHYYQWPDGQVVGPAGPFPG